MIANSVFKMQNNCRNDNTFCRLIAKMNAITVGNLVLKLQIDYHNDSKFSL